MIQLPRRQGWCRDLTGIISTSIAEIVNIARVGHCLNYVGAFVVVMHQACNCYGRAIMSYLDAQRGQRSPENVSRTLDEIHQPSDPRFQIWQNCLIFWKIQIGIHDDYLLWSWHNAITAHPSHLSRLVIASRSLISRSWSFSKWLCHIKSLVAHAPSSSVWVPLW
jgi:hypothetical protein